MWKKAGSRADGPANRTLAAMRAKTSEGALASGVTFSRGLRLHADPALELTGQYRSPPGQLLDLEARTGPDPGDWLALHLALRLDDLSAMGVVGFATRMAAPETLVVRACVRSGTDTGFTDCFFDKHLLVHAHETSHVDALHVGKRADLPLRAPWRDVILFLPTRAFQLSLIDMRVFVV